MTAAAEVRRTARQARGRADPDKELGAGGIILQTPAD
jgi:hypothetical protein